MSTAHAGEAPVTDDSFVVMGRISGVFGVRGWVKVFSHTEPRDGIAGYDPVYLRRPEGWQQARLEDGRDHGRGVVLKFRGCDDRDRAAALIGSDIAVRRDQLPENAPGEYYWAELEGLEVVTLEGVVLGRVDHLFETGANDVMVVRGERERLLPYLPDKVVIEVDLGAGRMRVDWDPEF